MSKHDLPPGAVSLSELMARGFNRDGRWAGETLDFSKFYPRPEGDYLAPVRTELSKKSPNIHPNSIADYILMPQAKTYALGLHRLQVACAAERNQHQEMITLSDGRRVYRANTPLDNILARINDWETLYDANGNNRTTDERKRYFDTFLDSCCGIAYQAKSTKLKLQLVCPSLMDITADFKNHFLSVNYASFSGQELDSSDQNFVRDAWMTLLDDKVDIYTAYLRILRVITEKFVTPNFWVRSKDNLNTDELRTVYISNLRLNSNADGFRNFSGSARFLRRSP